MIDLTWYIMPIEFDFHEFSIMDMYVYTMPMNLAIYE